MNPSDQEITLTFPVVPRDQQFTLITKLHTLLSETEDLHQIKGDITIRTRQP